MERTASQTIGPFFHEGLRWRDGGVIAFAEPGKRIVLTGRIFDGAGEPVGDAMVEAWQHSPSGYAPSPAQGAANPHGFGRVETAMPGGEHPHIDIAIFARGLLKALRTRVYLEPEDKAGADPAVAALKGSPRLKTLVAAPSAGGEYRWDIRLQGEGETVFFAF